MEIIWSSKGYGKTWGLTLIFYLASWDLGFGITGEDSFQYNEVEVVIDKYFRVYGGR